MSANYILTIAEHDHKTPAQVVGDMVRERIAAATVTKQHFYSLSNNKPILGGRAGGIFGE
jgi:hypothetical protein